MSKQARPPYMLLIQYPIRPGRKSGEYRLFYSSGLIHSCGFKRGEFVTYKWLEDESAMVIKRVPEGTLDGRKLVACQNKSALYSAASYFVHCCDVPRHPHPLPILDIVDDEIWVDLSGEVAAKFYGAAGKRNVNSYAVMKELKERSKRSARLLANFSGGGQSTGRTYPKLIEVGQRVAKEEKRSFSAFVENAVAYYVEKEYPDFWDAIKKA